MKTKTVVSAVIHFKYGWAVQEQFESTWDAPFTRVFEEQNPLALKDIRTVINDLLENGVFSEKVVNEIKEYKVVLEDFLERRMW